MTEDRRNLPHCGVCGTEVASGVACERCSSPHHPDCWEFNQGCSIFGLLGGAVAVPAMEQGKRSFPLTIAPQSEPE